MQLNRIMIAAPCSKSGKTTITCALLQTLKNMGMRTVSYKCGPDYIDPMFHKKVLGIPSKNLDTFFTGEEETRALFLKDRTEADFAVIEGVMGIFDGLGGVRKEGSSYHLAETTGTPIILTVDAKGMGRSVIPLIAGFLAYDTEHLIKGVILNRMNKSYYEIISPLIEKELGICAAGYFEDSEEYRLESRHLGLRLPDETAHISKWIEAVSQEFQKTVSVTKIIQIAQNAPALEKKTVYTCIGKNTETDMPVIAVARDEAFCFYYEDNIRMLCENGAKTEYFSPLRDKKLPDGCSAVLLGGGYPELYAKELSANTAMLKAIKDAADDEMPIVAECGGFMYLHSELKDKKGNSYFMAGVIPASCHDTGKLVRFGYIELEEKQSSFLPKGEKIKGHEFHYYDSEDNGSGCLAVKPATGRSYPCVITAKNCWMGFPHIYYPSNPSFVRSFIEKAKEYKERKSKIYD